MTMTSGDTQVGKHVDFTKFVINRVDAVGDGDYEGYQIRIFRKRPTWKFCDECGAEAEYTLDASEDLGTNSMIFGACQECMVARYTFSQLRPMDSSEEFGEARETTNIRVDGDFEVKANDGVIHHFTKVDNDQNRMCEGPGMCNGDKVAVYKIESTNLPTEYACLEDAESIMDQLR